MAGPTKPLGPAPISTVNNALVIALVAILLLLVGGIIGINQWSRDPVSDLALFIPIMGFALTFMYTQIQATRTIVNQVQEVKDDQQVLSGRVDGVVSKLETASSERGYFQGQADAAQGVLSLTTPQLLASSNADQNALIKSIAEQVVSLMGVGKASPPVIVPVAVAVTPDKPPASAPQLAVDAAVEKREAPPTEP